METETIAKARDTYWISLDQIDFHPGYFNRHNAEDIEAMARDISEGGQINPIEVRLKPNDRYEIITGGGRYQAIQSLREATESDKWEVIECTIRTDSDDEYQEWSRRLSENLIRTPSSWIEQALYFAKMKASGDVTAKIAKRYGMSETHIDNMIAIGKIPGIEKVAPPRGADIDVSFRDVRDYVLPLRIQTDRQGNVPIWDYSEVTACIEKLASGELSREDLPAHSAERREAIGKAKKTEEKPDSAETTKLQKELEEFREAAENRKAHDRKKVQELEQKNASLVSAIQMLEANYTALESKLPGSGGETEENKKLQEELQSKAQELEEVRKALQELKIQQQSQTPPPGVVAFDMSAFPDAVANIRQQVEEEFRAKSTDKELTRRLQELEAREAEFAEKQKQFKQKLNDAMDTDAQDFDSWKHNLEIARREYLKQIGLGTTNKYWTQIDHDELSQLHNKLEEVSTKMKAFFAKYEESSEQPVKPATPSRSSDLNQHMIKDMPAKPQGESQ